MSLNSKVGCKFIARSCLSIAFAALIIQSGIPAIAATGSSQPFHSVTFIENDNTNDQVYSSQTANTSSPLTEFANLNPSFANAGYGFVDWNTSPDGTGSSFANGSTFSFASSEVLYAIWSATYHSVAFGENDNLSDPIYAVQTENAPTALTLFANLSPSLSNPGFTFVDWNTQPNGGGTSFSDGSTYSFSSATDLYPVWAPVPTMTLNFDTSSGTG